MNDFIFCTYHKQITKKRKRGMTSYIAKTKCTHTQRKAQHSHTIAFACKSSWSLQEKKISYKIVTEN